MHCIIFDVQGEYAHFKKPYSSASPVSFPFPPPTAVLGLLGAILGYRKHEYHERLGWQSIRIGIRLLKPIQVFRTAINLLHTKDGTDAYFRPKADKNSHTPMPYEFIKSPSYRLYIANLPEKAASGLVTNLTQGLSVYSPSLGLASCLADIEWVGETETQALTVSKWETNTVVPLTTKEMKIYYDDNRRYHRFRVPTIMDSNRIVHHYQEVILADNTKTISGTGGDNLFFEVNNETIAFFPNLLGIKS